MALEASDSMKQSDMKEKKYFKDLSRRDYIEKANEIVRRDGVQGLTIRRIAQEMNCSSACLYHYFENVEELLFYAQIGFLNYYLEEINRHEKQWKDAWDLHIGIWECYSRAAFTYPEAFNTIFFSSMSKKLPSALREYYELFPEHINLVSPHLRAMLETPDFFDRDMQMCEKCVAAGVISEEKARYMNRYVCMLYKGYLKGILDSGIESQDIEGLVERFLREVRLLVALLADDVQGHEELLLKSYF